MKIKVCGLTNKNNILKVAGLKPDFLGFIFYPPSPRYMVDKLQPDDLIYMESSSRKTGVFVNADYYEICSHYWNYNLDCIQLHGQESPGLCKHLSSSGIEVIKAFSIREGFDFGVLADFVPYCSYFLFDTYTEKKGGSGKKFNWDLIRSYDLKHPFFLSGGIGPGDLNEIIKIKHSALAGVDLNSRFEEIPGIKNISQLKEFMNQLRKQVV
jgi:phosphoribosylanthranilate isomerase